MGRYTVESSLSIRTLDAIEYSRRTGQMNGILRWQYAFSESSIGFTLDWSTETLTLAFTDEGGSNPIRQRIELQHTRPRLGGKRWWMTCPSCQRRCDRLHLTNGADRFACRKCHDLTYDLCNQSKIERELRRMIRGGR